MQPIDCPPKERKVKERRFKWAEIRSNTFRSDSLAQGARVTGSPWTAGPLAAGEVFPPTQGAPRRARLSFRTRFERGAAAVLWARRRLRNGTWPGARPTWGSRICARLAGALAHEVYGRPSENCGRWRDGDPNGKTSCSHWIAQACGACGARTAVIGTLGHGLPGPAGKRRAWKFVAGLNTRRMRVALHRSLANCWPRGRRALRWKSPRSASSRGA